MQRWVKDCDAASARDGAYGDPIVLRVLDSVLRTADPTLVGKADSKSGMVFCIFCSCSELTL